MNTNGNLADELCDIFPNKVCDNCGKCLENEGIDLKAIKIEDIARNVDENDFVEEELIELDEDNYDDLDLDVVDDENDEVIYEEEEYEDAWDHIEYIDDLQDILDDDTSIQKLTEEVYPGLIKIKRRE
ncbi:hypothetical protein [Clostridium folliculivorans]|uniref:Uncharacterized protein n=1 Tax=Clostridium folliculivorans TaxID=2886038 RepID=A0A9W6DA14_9CLOT|nr:hypothetical protein [Clostridium folliculivorans]GKU24719.1 hypothetical protein CFOLD11_15450 [Clostridium folliculivorans]GKU30817.1 hypothetical protein CFB3_29240 [Clostridium folliculivorans]